MTLERSLLFFYIWKFGNQLKATSDSIKLVVYEELIVLTIEKPEKKELYDYVSYVPDILL